MVSRCVCTAKVPCVANPAVVPVNPALSLLHAEGGEIGEISMGIPSGAETLQTVRDIDSRQV